MSSVTNWVENNLNSSDSLKVLGRTDEDFLIIKPKNHSSILVAVIGVQGVVRREHVDPVFSGMTKPAFVMNVPSKTPWSGSAITHVHAAPAAFGTLGDMRKAATRDEVWTYRNSEWSYFERAIRQHTNVSQVTRIYDAVFEAHRHRGKTLTIALIEAYNMSAEHVRNARDLFGKFDIAVKISSYGGITSAADEAATSMGAEAVMFRGLMQRLAT